MREEKLARLFDLVGEEFDCKDAIFDNHYEQMSIVCRACFSGAEFEDKEVLDAGCGTGTASVYFAREGARAVVGVDMSVKSLEVGSKWRDAYRLENLSFQKGDLRKLPFADGRFDAVFSCGAIPYVPDIYAAIDELIRVTKKGGILLLFILKKGRLDGLYETARLILSKCPAALSGPVAGFLSIMILPVASLFLKRDIKLTGGKPLRQTILENLFSPVALAKIDPKEVVDHFAGKGFSVKEITGISGVDFYSRKTIFICKAQGAARGGQ